MPTTISHLNTWLLYLLLFIICFIASLIIIKIQGVSEKMTGGKGKSGKKGSPLGWFLLIFLILLAIILFTVTAFVFSFIPFVPANPCAKIMIQQQKGETTNYNLLITIIKNGGTTDQHAFRIKGTGWIISSEILIWSKLLTSFGLGPMFRITSIQGSYLTTDNHNGGQTSQYEVMRNHKSLFHSFALQVNRVIPIAHLRSYRSSLQSSVLNQTYSLYITSENSTIVKNDNSNNHQIQARPYSSQPAKIRQRGKYPGKEEDIRR